MCNPVTMQVIAHKMTKADLDLNYSTDVTITRLTDIAERYNATMKTIGMPVFLVVAEDVKGFV